MRILLLDGAAAFSFRSDNSAQDDRVGNVQIITIARSEQGVARMAEFPPTPQFWIQVQTH